jgi:hypothetical protein
MMAHYFRAATSTAALVLVLVLPGWVAAQQQSPDLLSLWLLTDCEVGTEGVLQTQVAQAGAQLVPGFVQAAQNGPDASTLAAVTTAAGREFDQIEAFLAAGGAVNSGIPAADIQTLQNLSRNDFVAQETNDFVFSYEARALVGLGIVGGPTALEVLQSFANSTGSRLQPIAQQALGSFAGPTTMAGNITSKAGPLNARVWTLTLTNNGPAVAMGAQINSVNLTQTFGAACAPVIASPGPFPLTVGSIAPAGSESTAITINFTGCPANARFTANISFSANSGTVIGTVIRYNQFE